MQRSNQLSYEATDVGRSFYFVIYFGKVQKQPRFKVKIDGTWIVMTADSGSSVNIHDDDERLEIARLINEYNDIFTGLGKLKGFRVNFHMDETVQPVAQPHQRIPFQVHKQLERQLDVNEENDVI